MSDYLFGVIIPAYNSAAYIGEAIESVISQKVVSLEVIVVDDGSRDNTIDIVKSFGNQVKIISQKNAGSSAARNRGATESSAKFLAFLDADDIWLPEKLRLQKIKIEQGYNMIYTNRLNFGNVGDLPEIQSDVFCMQEGDIFEYLLLGNVITNSSAVISRDKFFALKGFRTDLTFCEDWDLWLRYAANDEIGFCENPLVKYRIHSLSKSRNYKEKYKNRKRIITDILNTERGRGLSNAMKRKVWACTYSTSAWEAAKAKDLVQALQWYIEAIRAWPFDFGIWYNVARALAGRI